MAVVPAIALLPFLTLRSIVKQKLSVLVLATEGEFGPFVFLMEHLRGKADTSGRTNLIFVLSRRRHALCDIYETELGCRIVAGNWFWQIIQQALLMQPHWSVEFRRLTHMDVRSRAVTQIRQTNQEKVRSARLLESLNLSVGNYVSLAVHTLKYDAENNPQYLTKESSLESVGDELAEAIDVLKARSLGVVLLGSLDTGKSRIPREIPRLLNFSQLGSLDEVLIAAGCKYFWSDCVGAWWLSAPYGKPVLMTNEARLRTRKNSFPGNHLMTPVCYRNQSGRILTFREVLGAGSSLYKAAGRGEMELIRNTPTDLVHAHLEMLLRLSGDWTDTDEMRDLQDRFEALSREFPDTAKVRIASSFLNKHRDLLDS